MRKLIDINDEILTDLKLVAVKSGAPSLKNYIEGLCEKAVRRDKKIIVDLSKKEQKPLLNKQSVSVVKQSETAVCNNEANKCPKYMSDKNGEKGCVGCEFYY